MILGHPWLRYYNPYYNYKQSLVIFFRDFYKTYCLLFYIYQYIVRGINYFSPKCSNKLLPKLVYP
jgi:hypothetical protein